MPRDHPRVCGEHCCWFCWAFWSVGSSPRVRGTRALATVGALVSGIIPACAGNTDRRRSMCSVCRDHPRVCGEHRTRSRKLSSRPGSSPRVRGTHFAGRAAANRLGIIPACAGNTLVSFMTIRVKRDHPRVCGEHFMAFRLDVPRR